MRPVESFETSQNEMKGSTCQLILNQDQGMFQTGGHAAYERVRYSSGISSDQAAGDLSCVRSRQIFVNQKSWSGSYVNRSTNLMGSDFPCHMRLPANTASYSSSHAN